MKGYKVTDSSRKRTVGIAVSSLAQLLSKGRAKLNITEDVNACLDDGTVVDDEDYFQTLSSQTIFIFYKSGDTIVRGVDLILNALRSVNSSYLNAGAEVSDFLIHNINTKTKELTALLEESSGTQNNLIEKSTRQQDPDWFSGLETNAVTKEDFMFRRSQDRIRGYLYKAQEDIKKNKNYVENFNQCRTKLDECLQYFRNQLQKDAYFGCYFDRRCAGHDRTDSSAKRIVTEFTEDEVDTKRRKTALNEVDFAFNYRNQTYTVDSYCGPDGEFMCQGPWNLKCCNYTSSHVINPYLNRESRIIFSTWNLDHRIEKSRTIVPKILSISQDSDKTVNAPYFYTLLFTNANLKLVHVVCHDKQLHSIKCEDEKCTTNEKPIVRVV